MCCRFFVLTILTTLVGFGEACAAEPTKVFKAGAYAVEITPTKFPVLVNGMMTTRTAHKAFDPLHSRALVLDDGTTRLAIVVVDSVALSRELLDQAKELAAKATGIPTERMLISATHTHSAPAAISVLGCDVDPDYPGFLIPQIARSIQLAANQLRPAKIGWGVVKNPRHTASRRSIRRSDRVDKDPFGEPTVRANMYSPEPIGPSGPVDDEISMLAVQTTDGQPIALLANYATHYYGTPPVSADYYGRFCEQFAKLAAPDQQDLVFVGIMSQGTSGDIHGGGAGNIDNYAREIAQVAFEAYQKIQYQSWVPLAMREAKQTVKRRVPSEARLTWAKKLVATFEGRPPASFPEVYAREQLFLHEEPQRELKFQVIGIGDLGVTALPNEVFSLTGMKLKLQSPFAQTMNVELANGCEGYIPPPEQHVLGGYTTWAARTAGLEVGTEPGAVETLLSLLEQASGKPRRSIETSKGAYSESVLKSQPVGYWRMAELAGRQAADASDHHCAAQYEDGVVFYLEGPPAAGFSTPGRINRGAHFAGGRMRAELPKIGSTYSAEFWFWNGFPNDARPVTGYLFSHGPEGDKEVGDHLGISGTFLKPGRLIFFNGDQRNQVVAGRTVIEPRTWNHVVLVRDGKQVRVYLNGNPEPELSGEAELSLADNDPWFFGGRSDNFTNLEGKLDEAAVYNRALTAGEVATHYRDSGTPPKANAPSADGLTWQPLLKGDNLDGWYTYLQQQGKNSDPQRVFQIEDGGLHIYKDVANDTPMPFGYMCTEKEYSHYRLRFEYRWGKNRFAPRTEALRDSGVLYHCVGPDGAFLGVWPRCVEYQVQEGDTGDTYPVGTTISTTVSPNTRQFAEPANGGVLLTGVQPIRHSDRLEVDGWNTCEVIVDGDKATHILNGKVNNRSFDMRQPDPQDPNKLVPLTKGRILLQGEGAEILYRNIEIAFLPEPKAAPLDAQGALPAVDPRSEWRQRVKRELSALPEPPSLAEPRVNPIDAILASWWTEQGIEQPAISDDRAFIRRAYLDLVGLLPDEAAIEEFSNDLSPSRREALIDSLLADDAGYAEHWVTFWADLLRDDKSNYIAVTRYPITRWLLRSLEQNKPYDEFVAELLNPHEPESAGFVNGIEWTNSSSVSEIPPMQVAQVTSQVFQGVNLKCASCHNHFTKNWKLDQSWAFASFFSPKDLQPYGCDKPEGTPVAPRFLFDDVSDGIETLTAADLSTRLEVVSVLVTRPKNLRFATTIVNRLFKKLVGQGLINEVDDLDGYKAFKPELLDRLAYDFMANGYDLKQLVQTIATSRVYQMRPIDGERLLVSKATAPPNEAIVPMLFGLQTSSA